MLVMSGEDEFGEFSSGGEGWGAQDNTNGSSDWLSYSDNQHWGSAVPNSEQPPEQPSWNASFPELPKELSNLLSEEIPNLSNPNAFTTTGDPPDFVFSNNGIGNIDNDEFGDFESSFSENTIISTTGITSQLPKSNGDPSVPTDKTKHSWEPDFSTASKIHESMGNKDTPVTNESEDDEFGDFEGGTTVPQKELTPEFSNFESSISTTVPNHSQKESTPEFGGFVSSTTESKEEQLVSGDDDFGSFEAVQFVAASLPPVPKQAAPPVSNAAPSIIAVATPTSVVLPSASFSEIAENCFHLDQGSTHQQSSIDEPITVLTKQSR